MTDRLLTTRELAELLGLSPATVLRRHRAGEIPGYRLSVNVLRFRESEIEVWLGGRRRGGQEEEVRPTPSDRPEGVLCTPRPTFDDEEA